MDFFLWFITSSANPAKSSRAVKGFVLALAPLTMIVFGWTDADITQFAESLSNITFWVLSAIAAAQVAYGLIRKINLARWSAGF
ncbi:hypothetical protein [Bradyrhizobium sp. CCGB20]|uniref:hypothetical protein n=1 Tax=Bradyrhizobium sp. CCGB20 TaxID=2949633 RepID=UPI0020B3F9E3|nr:hypothetical protein [Bradyrhizobium sp. CCGB20]MCP3396221.1 hypothetical protein [Bradyrhizobium sp. CCGB20]